MSSIVKSISLDARTATIAQRIPNLSRFVRECLMRYDIAEGARDYGCEREEGGRLCMPYKAAYPGRCIVCWPAGPPDKPSWSTYLRPTNEAAGMQWRDETGRLRYDNPHHMDHEWLQSMAEKINPPLFPLEGLKTSGNAKPKSKPKSRSFIGRMLKKLGK